MVLRRLVWRLVSSARSGLVVRRITVVVTCVNGISVNCLDVFTYYVSAPVYGQSKFVC